MSGWSQKILRRASFPLLSALFFGLVTVAMTWPMAAALGDHYTSRQDFYLNLWILDHVAEVVSDGRIDFYRSEMIYHPVGTGLESLPMSLVQTLPAVPLTLAFGPLVAFNLLVLISFWFAGFAASLWIRSLCGDSVAALMGGVMFSFAPYHYLYIPQIGMAAIGFLPLFFLADLWYSRQGGCARGLLAGGALGLVGLGAWYYGIIAGLAAVVLSVVRLARKDGLPTRDRVLSEACYWLGCLVVLAPVVLRILPAYVGQAHAEGGAERVGMGLIMESFKGTPVTVALWSFCGIATLALAAVGCLSKRRVAGLMALVVGFFVLSLGMRVSFGELSIPLPYAVLTNLPVVSAIRFPDRFFVMVLLGLAALAAFGAQRLLVRVEHKPWICALLIALPLAEFWPGTLQGVSAPADVPVPAAGEGHAGAVVHLPLTYKHLDGETLYHQTRHERAVAGGYLTRPDPGVVARLMRDPALGAFAGRPADILPVDLAQRLRDSGIAFVCVHRRPAVAGAEVEDASMLGPFSLSGGSFLRQRLFPVYGQLRAMREAARRLEARLTERLGEPSAVTDQAAVYEVPLP